MRRKEEKITLLQLLECLYFHDPECDEQIQIVFQYNDWDKFDQLYVRSEFLIPFFCRTVDCISVEDGIMRIGIDDVP